MTNTLHRRGKVEDLQRDFVIFALVPSEYKRRPDVAEKMRRFREIVGRHGPINRPRPDLGPYPDINRVEPVKAEPGASATFDSFEKVKAAVADLVAADLGISVNISGPLESVQCACRAAGIERHSAEHSLGVLGSHDLLPTGDILEITTLCGHGMVSHNVARRMIDLVKQRKLSPSRAAEYLSRPCTCGVFNTSRAVQVLERTRTLG